MRSTIYLTLLGVAVILLAMSATVFAQEGKIGYIDSQRILTESKDFADAQAKFDKDVEQWNKQAEDLQAEIDELETELESQSLLLSKAKREEKQNLLKAKKEAFQDYVDNTFGPDGKAERRNAELVRPIRDKIMRIIERIAIEENYTIIFDASATSIAYAKKDLNLTEKVLEELEREN